MLALTCSEPPDEVTHWTGRALAKRVGISLRAVQRIWEAHRLQPHRVRTFKRSHDPAFAAKVEDVVGLYRGLQQWQAIHHEGGGERDDGAHPELIPASGRVRTVS